VPERASTSAPSSPSSSGTRPRIARGHSPRAPLDARSFVGREGYLRLLHDALTSVRHERAVALFVHAGSGVGKTALVRQFVRGVSETLSAVVLEGRCHERESVPFKALDPLVDALGRYLKGLGPVDARALLPRHAWALARLFPALSRVPAVAASKPAQPAADEPDPQELRRLALGALRSILSGMAARAPLILWLDDLHWTDRDSAILLTDLLRAPDVPGFLFIASHRTDEGTRNPALRALVHAVEEGSGATLTTSKIALSAMSPEEATALARQVAVTCRVPHIDADLIARETGGNPFFVHELVRHAASREEAVAAGLADPDTPGGEPVTPTLEQALRERMGGLPDAATRMLELIAVAGGPVARAGIRLAAGLGEDEREAMSALRAGNFVSTQGPSEEIVETYHDRIRETVIAGLSDPRRRALHLELARSLVALDLGDPQTLAQHFAVGGARREARRHAARAAEEAMRTLAFDRAVELYRMVLDLTDDAPAGDGTAAAAASDRLAMQRALGDALANSGRGDQAAREYLAVAEKQHGLPSLELRRMAAEHLLISGRIEEGKAALDSVLNYFGLKLARSRLGALRSMMWNRLRIKVRGLDYVLRDAREIPEETLALIDACWAVAVGLGQADFLQGMAYHARFVLLSLETGEPHRLARAAAQEVAFLALPGVKARRRVERMLVVARDLARQIGSAHVLALAEVTAGLADYLVGRWSQAFHLFESAEDMLVASGVGVQWELSTARRYVVSALWYMGNVKELVRRLAIADAAARERGNLHAATSMQARFAHLERLAADAPDEAWARVDEAMRFWPENAFMFAHYNELISRTQVLLYRGQGRAAWEHLTARDRRLKRAMLLRVELLRLEHRYARGRAALAAALDAAAAGDQAARAALLAAAETSAAELGREKAEWVHPFAAVLRAGAAAQRGDTAAAVALLHRATAGFLERQMGLYAAASKRRLGQLLGGENGTALVREADAMMTEQGIKSPARMTRMLASGFPGPAE
jgi:eukaryotic-like serine/threonine-protein kinase